MRCNPDQLGPFLADELEIEDKLEFLYHLDECGECWESVYNAIKSQHPHFYRSAPRRVRVSKKKVEDLFEVA